MSKNMDLKPYVHQVTGRVGLLTTDDQALILKPVSSNEHQFYVTMAPELRCFAPRYFGIADVTYKKVNGDVHSIAVLPLDDIINHSDCVTMTSLHVHQSQLQYEGLERWKFGKNEGFQSHRWTKDKDMDADISGVGKNPWVLRLQNKVKEKLERYGTHLTKPCLILENVASDFKVPCIIDFKVGTRLFGDDCPHDKVQRHYEKDELSTTATLGLRISGFQVYQDHRYICRDKLFGRGLSRDGVLKSLRLFLQSENRVRTELISPILRMLEKLIVVLNDLTSYRLYGASLVVVYEGLHLTNEDKFHCSSNGCSGNTAQEIHTQEKTNASPKSDQKHASSSLPSNWSCDPELEKLRHKARVDVRVVDFGHCTNQKMTGQEKLHLGPDTGFIFGLKNLIKLLKQI